VIPLRIYLAGAAAVLALSGGTALAAPALMGSVSHGDGASGAAATCAHSTGSAHGACVSAAAQSRTTHSSDAGGQSGESDNGSKPGSSPDNAHGMAVSAAAKSCAHGTASDRDAHGDCVSAVARGVTPHTGGR